MEMGIDDEQLDVLVCAADPLDRGRLSRVADSPAARQLREAIAAPASASSARPRRRRAALVLLASVCIGGAGLSVAAEAGVPILPQSVLQAMGWEPEPGAYNADPGTGRLLLTTAGPDGQPMQLWFADANDNGFCVRVLEGSGLPTDLTQWEPNEGAVRGLAGGCSDRGADWNSFGGTFVAASGHITTPDASAVAVFAIHVPGATHVELAYPDGTRQPLPLADDWTAGWFPLQTTPKLVGYDANGNDIDRLELTEVLHLPK